MSNTFVVFQKSSSGGGKWLLTDIADHTQLGSPARRATKRRMIQSSSSQGNMDDTVRRLEQQLQEYRIREEQLRIEKDRFQRRAEEQQKQTEDSNTRSEALQRQVADSNRRAEDSYQRAERAEERVQHVERSLAETRQSLRQSERLEQQLQEYRIREEQLRIEKDRFQRRAEEQQKQTEDSNTRSEALQRQVADSNRRAEDSNRRAERAEERVQHVERSLVETRQSLRQSEDRYQISSTHWAVRREEIELTGPELGVGGWATVTVAKFRGTQVAVKRIHNQIISRHNIQLFQREMNIAARLRHPNLIQFIGATMEGEMMIIMELMATSLRSQLETEEYFQPKLVKAISLDVGLGLNYLHLIQPDPIVHRDISSANVLLEELPHSKWRAKLTDYGSVNVVCQLRTENPGSPAYAAPEASNPRLQSPKMDIFSFGVLILEMLTGRLPVPDQRPCLLCQVHHEQLLRLIRWCLSENPEDRRSAGAIISELSS